MGGKRELPVECYSKETGIGVEIDRSEVRLPEGPLRALGEYQVEVYLHPEVSAQVTVMIEAEEAFPS